MSAKTEKYRVVTEKTFEWSRRDIAKVHNVLAGDKTSPAFEGDGNLGKEITVQSGKKKVSHR